MKFVDIGPFRFLRLIPGKRPVMFSRTPTPVGLKERGFMWSIRKGFSLVWINDQYIFVMYRVMVQP